MPQKTPEEMFVEWFETVFGAAHQGISIELSAVNGRVVIQGLRVDPPRRQGRGRMALNLLCSMSDKAGVTLEVTPEPLTLMIDSPITRDALRQFYLNAGFTSEGALLIRTPKPQGLAFS